MKADERHKLKKNELADWLRRIPELGQKYARWLIGGAVLVVLIISVVLFINHRRQAYRTSGWNELGKARTAEQYARVAKEFPDLSPISAMALYMQADQFMPQASAGSADAAKRAADIYNRIISDRPHHPVVTPLARMQLANLALVQEPPDIAKAQQLLRTVQADAKADRALQALAAARANELDNAEVVKLAAMPTEPPATRPDWPGSLDQLLVPGFDAPIGPPPSPPAGENSGEPGAGG